MTRVQLRPDESPESLLKRFESKVNESGVLREVRRKRWYTSPSEIRRLEQKKAVRRARRRQQQGKSRERF